jgi:hypothetical protein
MDQQLAVFAQFANTLAKGGNVKILEQEKGSERTKQFSDFLQASKKISQLIAESWLPEGEQIKKVLLSDDEEAIKELLKDKGIDLEGVFGIKTLFVNWDSFYGTITELGLAYYLPYPPRPVVVEDYQLEEWVNNTEPNTLFPPYPYIPLSAF